MYNSLRYHLNNMKLLYKLDKERYLNTRNTLITIGIMFYVVQFIQYLQNEKSNIIDKPNIAFIYITAYVFTHIIIYMLFAWALSSAYDTLFYGVSKKKIMLLRDLIDGMILIYILDYFYTL